MCEQDLVSIGRMVRKWRERVDREDLPGFTVRYGRKSARGLTQDDVSRLIGFSARWYSNLERGVPTPYSDAFLDSVSRVLALSDEERLTLYTYTVQRQPLAGRKVDTSIIDPALARFVHMQPYPCYVSDQGWDIPIYNKAAAEQWRWMAQGVNVMLWALTHPEARLQLIDWEQAWACPMAAQLHLAMNKNPDNERLREVVDEVRKDPTARRIYDEGLRNIHPDGSRRRVYLPHHHDREFEVVFVALSPLRDPSYRLMAVVPADECTDLDALAQAA
ncbi:helix-turn-helix domain-containing protein [Streptomyces sp. NPDC053048]|uniref:helix-turn-helix domain-containing protein n=1 Tax=Streptomyces sp. NPDC053048 TaxID=3365694 RepID=UPI0037D50D65